MQPSKDDPNFGELIKILGSKFTRKDYNHSHRYHNYHFFIGKDNDETLRTVMTLPLEYRAWPQDKYIHVCICKPKKIDDDFVSLVLKEIEII